MLLTITRCIESGMITTIKSQLLGGHSRQVHMHAFSYHRPDGFVLENPNPFVSCKSAGSGCAGVQDTLQQACYWSGKGKKWRATCFWAKHSGLLMDTYAISSWSLRYGKWPSCIVSLCGEPICVLQQPHARCCQFCLQTCCYLCACLTHLHIVFEYCLTNCKADEKL